MLQISASIQWPRYLMDIYITFFYVFEKVLRSIFICISHKSYFSRIYNTSRVNHCFMDLFILYLFRACSIFKSLSAVHLHQWGSWMTSRHTSITHQRHTRRIKLRSCRMLPLSYKLRKTVYHFSDVFCDVTMFKIVNKQWAFCTVHS